ncbi:MAG: hypothetical protein KHX03_03940 [Clostridium sp.]|nr:hypothetical protein [Clostridium sp.]
MIENLVGFISKALTPSKSTAVTAVRPASVNPFANTSANPFMSQTSVNSNFYGKNNPVRGGYFAGYYNGKPNIVGRRLFVEV